MAMNAVLPGNLASIALNAPVGAANNANVWNVESRVNGIWNGILTHAFPTTGALLSCVVCPEPRFVGGQADLVVYQFIPVPPGAVPPRMKPVIIFEGKGRQAGDTFANIHGQVQGYANHAGLGQLGRVWSILAKGADFKILATDHGRIGAGNWANAHLQAAVGGAPVAPTFTRAHWANHDGNGPLYSLHNLAHVGLLRDWLAWINLAPANLYPIVPANT